MAERRAAAGRRSGATSRLVNYSGHALRLPRSSARCGCSSAAAAAKALGAALPAWLKLVAFESENVLVNTGKARGRSPSGLLSIWILGMFTPTPAHDRGDPLPRGSGRRARADRQRRLLRQGPRRSAASRRTVFVFFKGDGEQRGKIGLSPARATPVARRATTPQRGVLTIVQLRRSPRGAGDYVNSMWEIQKQPYARRRRQQLQRRPARAGRASRSGRSTSSRPRRPAQALAPGERLVHVHRTFHAQGDAAGARRARAQRCSASRSRRSRARSPGRPTR